MKESRMTLYEKDLVLANKLLDIRIALEKNKILKDNVVDYVTEDKSISIYVYKNPTIYVGCLKNEFIDIETINLYSGNSIEYCDVKKFTYFDFPHKETYEIDYSTELSEEWYFQNSLLYSINVLRIMTIFKVLNSVESDYQFFSFNLRHLDEFYKRIVLS